MYKIDKIDNRLNSTRELYSALCGDLDGNGT